MRGNVNFGIKLEELGTLASTTSGNRDFGIKSRRTRDFGFNN